FDDQRQHVSMSTKQPITPGAQRSLERAAQLAVSEGAKRVETNHMLWALWLEEGNAAAVLASLGVGRQQIELTATEHDSSIAVSVDGMAEDILYEARQFARRFRHLGDELTSEHLLLALTVSRDSLLDNLGITEQRIIDLVFPAPDTSSLPVSSEFQITEGEPAEVQQENREPDQRPAAVRKPSISADHSTLVMRTIDASANRVREGLRVVEDYTRFVLSDRILTTELKECRHHLAGALATLDTEKLLRCRDTSGDTGTSVTTDREHSRESLHDVVFANLKRMQEALRTLEEFSKVLPEDGSISAAVEKIRYRSYTLEKAIAATIRANEVFSDRCLYLLVTEAICHLPWKDVVIQALDAGVSVIQLREKTLSEDELLERGEWLRSATESAGAIFIMNDRPDLAVATNADGVHVGQTEMSVAAARQVMGPGKLVGVSTHNLQQAKAAVLDGADYLGVGPVFETSTKTFDTYAGSAYVSEVSSQVSLPWFAIGGINLNNVNQALAAGTSRIAVTGAICGSDQPGKVAGMMSKALVR
ncbi:MAG: thiamine phosphate synthase, partial [Planctomycetaceae bacterium]